MDRIRNREAVRAQYGDDTRLRTRISIHEKYSVNKQGFGNWIYEQYDLKPNDRILELGCGEGGMWRGKVTQLPDGATLLLSDFSEGMLAAARLNIPENENVRFAKIDIQDIPCQDDSFDIVIANMMLYHVPDLDRGLSEVRRVLKKGGVFYAATYGENGVAEYLQRLLGVKEKSAKGVFTMQNGGGILDRHFASVELRTYGDHLEVTDAADLADYVLSLNGITDFGEVRRERLVSLFETKMDNGVIAVPKEYGMFIAR